MNMEQKIRSYFEGEHMPEYLSRRIETKMVQSKPESRRPIRIRAAVIAVSVVFAVLLACSGQITTAFADFYDFIVRTQNPDITEPLGQLDDNTIVSYMGIIDNDSGDITSMITVGPNTEVPVLVEQGRMIFVANGEHWDITDLCSEEKAFVYVLLDDTGVHHYFIVGGTPDSPGYQVFLQIPGKEMSGWICGGSAGVTTAGSDWLVRQWAHDGKEKVSHPWPLTDNNIPNNQVFIPAPKS